MATIKKYFTKDERPRYRVMWRDGKQQKSKSFDRFTAANDFKIALEHGKREGSYVEPNKETVKSFLHDWLEIHKEGLANSTIAGYKKNIEYICEYIGNIPLQRLNTAHIEKMYRQLSKDKKLSGTYLLYIHRVLNVAMKYACKLKLINNNPCQFVTTPKKNKFTAAFVKPEDIQKYLDLFRDAWIFPSIALSMICGLRRNETLALRWQDVDLKNGVIHVIHSVERINGEFKLKTPKSGKTRDVNMPQGMIDLLKAHKKKQKEMRLLLGEEYKVSDFVVTEDDGTRPDPRYATRFFMRRLSKSNLPYVRFHDLRHTAASLMLLEGIDIKTVSEVLGHSSITITMDIYGHVLDEAKKKAADSLNKYLL
jgi:integrase